MPVATVVSTIEPEELIPDVEAANILHVQRATLADWRFKKRGPRYLKVGRFVFYRRSDISTWLAAQLRNSQVA
jgi:predicted DNA-binding transcriptional regulator AlpA